jgi:hypothetical protein
MAKKEPEGVQLVRGSGPPMLTVEGNEIAVADRLWTLAWSSWSPRLPVLATVIGIDLTRRVVKFQTDTGQEFSWTPLPNNRTEDMRIFTDVRTAKLNCVKLYAEAIKKAEHEADRAIANIERAKKEKAAAEKWNGE